MHHLRRRYSLSLAPTFHHPQYYTLSPLPQPTATLSLLLCHNRCSAATTSSSSASLHTCAVSNIRISPSSFSLILYHNRLSSYPPQQLPTTIPSSHFNFHLITRRATTIGPSATAPFVHRLHPTSSSVTQSHASLSAQLLDHQPLRSFFLPILGCFFSSTHSSCVPDPIPQLPTPPVRSCPQTIWPFK